MSLAKPGTKPVKINAISIAKLMSALISGPCTDNELLEVSGLRFNTVNGYLRALRAEEVIYISGWEKDACNRDSIRVYAMGNRRDAKRSKKSKALIAREVRERRRLRLIQSLGTPQVVNNSFQYQ
jgi:transcription initiation factor IIE alpha subunit